MSDALVVRGQVYKHWQYKYPEEGNVADKLIIVLNKIHLPSQPIIVVPVSTYRGEGKFSLGYKPTLQEYFLLGNQDYFENDTKIQLYVLGLSAEISEAEFKSCQLAGVISSNPLAVLRQQTISEILKSLGQMKEDIRQSYHQYLF